VVVKAFQGNHDLAAVAGAVGRWQAGGGVVQQGGKIRELPSVIVHCVTP